MEQEQKSQYLACEHQYIFFLLVMSAGMMGAYTFNLRGGVFCNAQTANLLMMGIAFGKGDWARVLYFLIPFSAYFFGSFISELLPSPIRKLGLLRWDTLLILFEIVMLFSIGFIPLSVPHQVVQIMINFLASMQYNTFRQADGIPMATTFCTNHVRQFGIAIAKTIRKRDPQYLKRGFLHFGMLLCFIIGAISLTFLGDYLLEKSIWLCLIPLGICAVRLVYADLVSEKNRRDQKPCGH